MVRETEFKVDLSQFSCLLKYLIYCILIWLVVFLIHDSIHVVCLIHVGEYEPKTPKRIGIFFKILRVYTCRFDNQITNEKLRAIFCLSSG